MTALQISDKNSQRIRAAAVILEQGKVVLMHRNKFGREYYCFWAGELKKGRSRLKRRFGKWMRKLP